jgi:hypothetical protein
MLTYIWIAAMMSHINSPFPPTSEWRLAGEEPIMRTGRTRSERGYGVEALLKGDALTSEHRRKSDHTMYFN